MKIFVREYCRDVTVRIYGIDGDEHTKEFFKKYFSDVKGIYETTDEEREDYNTEAVYTIVKADYYNFLAQQIESIQKGIDEVAEAKFRNETEVDYTFDNCCYIV